MNKKREKRASDDLLIAGVKFVPFEKDEGEDGKGKLYVFRHRKARRAQARQDKLKWKDMTFEERMTQ